VQRTIEQTGGTSLQAARDIVGTQVNRAGCQSVPQTIKAVLIFVFITNTTTAILFGVTIFATTNMYHSNQRANYERAAIPSQATRHLVDDRHRPGQQSAADTVSGELPRCEDAGARTSTDRADNYPECIPCPRSDNTVYNLVQGGDVAPYSQGYTVHIKPLYSTAPWPTHATASYRPTVDGVKKNNARKRS